MKYYVVLYTHMVWSAIYAAVAICTSVVQNQKKVQFREAVAKALKNLFKGAFINDVTS